MQAVSVVQPMVAAEHKGNGRSRRRPAGSRPAGQRQQCQQGGQATNKAHTSSALRRWGTDRLGYSGRTSLLRPMLYQSVAPHCSSTPACGSSLPSSAFFSASDMAAATAREGVAVMICTALCLLHPPAVPLPPLVPPAALLPAPPGRSCCRPRRFACSATSCTPAKEKLGLSLVIIAHFESTQLADPLTCVVSCVGMRSG